MKKHLKPIGETDTWITPREITGALGVFDLDPGEHVVMPWKHATHGFTYHDDGLRSHWNGRVWLNPPFARNEIRQWVAKFIRHNNGLMMIPLAMETQMWHQLIFPNIDSVLVLNARPFFFHPDGSKARANAGQTIGIVAPNENETQILQRSNLGVVLKPMKP